MHLFDALRDLGSRRVAGVAALVIAAGTLLGACANVPQKAPSALAAKSAAAAPVAPEQDLLLKLLGGQFALQANDLVGGAEQFTVAAELSSDPAVAEEATRLALSVRDWPLAGRGLARWQQLAPQDPGIVQARAWIALGTQHVDAAYAGLDALAARGDEQGWRLIAQVLLSAEDKAVAAQLLERLATPPHLGAQEANWIAMSQLAFKLGTKPLAQRLADSAVDRFHGEEGYIWSARLALDRDDKTAARALYAEALQRMPDSARLRGGYAALLADSGDAGGAGRALARGPQSDSIYAARAAYAARAEDKPALVALYREVEADKSARGGKRLYLLGQVAEMLDKRDAALAWYRAIPDDDEHWFDAQLREAVVLDQLGRTKDALDFLHQLQAQTAEDNDQLGNVWLLEAELLVRRQRASEALALYTRALASRPDDPRLLYARALLAVDQGDLATGEHDLRRLIELKPDNADALNALGYTLADQGDRDAARQQEALALIERALKLKPDEPAILDSLGWVRYRMGDLDAALTALRRAYAKQPDPDIAAHLGEVLWVHGQHEEARRVWDEGRKKDASNKTLLEAIKRLAT